jgi:hypothetical protein
MYQVTVFYNHDAIISRLTGGYFDFEDCVGDAEGVAHELVLNYAGMCANYYETSDYLTHCEQSDTLAVVLCDTFDSHPLDHHDRVERQFSQALAYADSTVNPNDVANLIEIIALTQLQEAC